jgi:hypothetical protein
MVDGGASVDDTIAQVDARFAEQLQSYRDDVGG